MVCPNCNHVYPILNGIPNMVRRSLQRLSQDYPYSVCVCCSYWQSTKSVDTIWKPLYSHELSHLLLGYVGRGGRERRISCCLEDGRWGECENTGMDSSRSYHGGASDWKKVGKMHCSCTTNTSSHSPAPSRDERIALLVKASCSLAPNYHLLRASHRLRLHLSPFFHRPPYLSPPNTSNSPRSRATPPFCFRP